MHMLNKRLSLNHWSNHDYWTKHKMIIIRVTVWRSHVKGIIMGCIKFRQAQIYSIFVHFTFTWATLWTSVSVSASEKVSHSSMSRRHTQHTLLTAEYDCLRVFKDRPVLLNPIKIPRSLVAHIPEDALVFSTSSCMFGLLASSAREGDN